MRGIATLIRPVEEFIHARTAQRDHAADREAFADLEGRNGLLRLADRGLLAGDLREVAGRGIHDLLVGHGFADAHVHRDLGDAGHLHVGLEPEVRAQLRPHGLAIEFMQPG
jgi:hypothetical protein